MAWRDKVKNISGLAEMYGKNARLWELVDMVVTAGNINMSKSTKTEKKSRRPRRCMGL